MVNFSVQIEPGLPINEQIVFAVKKAIMNGQLKAGDRFPSVRDLSREFRINPVTIQKSITKLVNDGLLIIQPGIGSIVSQPALPSQAELDEFFKSEVEHLVIEAKRLSLSQVDLFEQIKKYWNVPSAKDAPKGKR